MKGTSDLLVISTRPPTPDEQRYIKQQCKPDLASFGCLAIAFGILPGSLVWIACGWIDLLSDKFGVYAGWTTAGLALVYGFVWYWPTERNRRRQADEDARHNIVEVLKVDCSRVTELFCHSSHEPCLVFDLGNDQLLYMQGQWIRWESTYGVGDIIDDGNDRFFNLLDPPDSFPSDSFVVTRLPNSGHVFSVKVTGDYLPVKDPIDALKPEYVFKDCEIIPGTFEQISKSLQAEYLRRQENEKTTA